MEELATVAGMITSAQSYVDVFGKECPGESAKRHVNHVYRSLVRVVHPDRYKLPCDIVMAEKAFTVLSQFKKNADEAIVAGNFGATTTARVTIYTRRGSHAIVSTLSGGDITASYETKSVIDGIDRRAYCKLARHERDNDLVKNEAMVIRRLHGDDAEDKWKRHIPILLDTFVYQKEGNRLQGNVLELLEGFCTLTQVNRAYPEGVGALHAVWMFRRMLMALGFAHDNDVVHGAVVPEHVMILPEAHGVVLLDWCYASIATDEKYPPIKALARGYRNWYPEEVLAKEPPSPATDIAMAVRCIIKLLGGNPETAVLPETVPRQLRAYLRGCLQTRQSMRPQNAWLLLKEFDELLEDMGSPYYPRRFRQFTMPVGIV